MSVSSLRSLLSEASHRLSDVGIEDSDLESRLLFSHVSELSLAQILGLMRDPYDNDAVLSRFEALLLERIQRKPLAYIIGKQGFCNRDYYISEGVLIPRPETELLIEIIRDRVSSDADTQGEGLLFLDIGFGSGIIPLELVQYYPKASFIAWDSSKSAYDLAMKNAAEFAPNKVQWRHQDFFEDGEYLSAVLLSQKKSFPELKIIVSSNPPYVSEISYQGLAPEVRDFEPKEALVAGPKGVEFYLRLLSMLTVLFKDYDWEAFFEIGFDQKLALQECLDGLAGYRYQFSKDLQGHDRVLQLFKS